MDGYSNGVLLHSWPSCTKMIGFFHSFDNVLFPCSPSDMAVLEGDDPLLLHLCLRDLGQRQRWLQCGTNRRHLRDLRRDFGGGFQQEAICERGQESGDQGGLI